jgi:hypothetical protein
MNIDTDRRRTYRLIFTAALTLVLGVIVYVLDRNPQQVYFLTKVLSHPLAERPVFGEAGSSLPSFAHVYAFILLTAALLPPTRGACLGATLFWLITDSAFEIGQHAAIAPLIASAVPAWFSSIPIIENTRAYFLNSTFDPIDIAAIIIGAIAAAATLQLTKALTTHHGEAIRK